MNQPITVTVTQDDIDGGVRDDGWNCPVARSCRRVFGRPCYAVPKSIMVLKDWYSGHDYVFRNIPKSVQSFIADFDARKPVQPFTFTLGE